MKGNNPAGSGKNRPALSMIKHAEMRGYKMVLLMLENLSEERCQSIASYGAKIILTPKTGGMEYARDLVEKMQKDAEGLSLDQFANLDKPLAHYETTGPEIWSDTEGRIIYYISAMGTTGSIMGVSRYLKEQNPEIRIIGAQPEEGSQISGIRSKWPEAYLQKIDDSARVDQIESVSQAASEHVERRLASEEEIFCGISAVGACKVALRISQQVENTIIVFIDLRSWRPLLVKKLFPFPKVAFSLEHATLGKGNS